LKFAKPSPKRKEFLQLTYIKGEYSLVHKMARCKGKKGRKEERKLDLNRGCPIDKPKISCLYSFIINNVLAPFWANNNNVLANSL
jgi:hypothetical protein